MVLTSQSQNANLQESPSWYYWKHNVSVNGAKRNSTVHQGKNAPRKVNSLPQIESEEWKRAYVILSFLGQGYDVGISCKEDAKITQSLSGGVGHKAFHQRILRNCWAP
jgi:hypothetical protein